VGRGAAEIGHLRMPLGDRRVPLEEIASGWGIQSQTMARLHAGQPAEVLRRLAGEKPLSAALVAQAAEQGDRLAQEVLEQAWKALAEAVCHVIALLCPRRVVIGGGVSLLGEAVLFAPLRKYIAERVFAPFAGLTDVVPAALGEEVVVHGALALARQLFDPEAARC
jgi:glucokinase